MPSHSDALRVKFYPLWKLDLSYNGFCGFLGLREHDFVDKGQDLLLSNLQLISPQRLVFKFGNWSMKNVFTVPRNSVTARAILVTDAKYEVTIAGKICQNSRVLIGC
jgi:hypothetical protein